MLTAYLMMVRMQAVEAAFKRMQIETSILGVALRVCGEATLEAQRREGVKEWEGIWLW